jgi:hypothetical protein
VCAHENETKKHTTQKWGGIRHCLSHSKKKERKSIDKENWENVPKKENFSIDINGNDTARSSRKG